MAPPVGTLRVGRYFLALLAIFAVLYMIVFWPGQRHTPKLATDLAGGTEVIFRAKTDNGQTPSGDSMNQAKQILSDRVNGTGVTNATVVIEGSDRIVVTIPGQSTADVNKLGAAAVLNFRGLVAPAVAVNCAVAKTGTGSGPSSGPSGSAANNPGASTTPAPSGAAAGERPLQAPAGSSSATGTATPAGAPPVASSTPTSANATPTGSPTATSPLPSPSATTPTAPACSADPLAPLVRAKIITSVPLLDTDFAKLTQTQQTAISQALSRYDCAAAQHEPDLPNHYFLACNSSGQAFLLGPVVVAGKQISDAAAVAPNISQGVTGWTVTMDLKSSGQSAWADYTSKHNVGGQAPTSDISSCGPSTTPCADYVGFTLDGTVISDPYNNETINGGSTQITGSFTSGSARDLANKLKYGALPLSFTLESDNPTSATLGSAQLKAGLLAGGIGLILVIIYSLLYYRALGLVTIASLLVSAALTYACLVLLGTQISFTLSLAGIAGFIVAVGITADSFVVFFERLKDEVHEGRSVRVAVPRAWVRARRTILSADTVSFLAAAILYYFAAGDVKGFAFTLGLSTILDLVVVFLFTHPTVSLLSRSRVFGSARFTGLDALRGRTPVLDDDPPPGSRRARANSDTDGAATATAAPEGESRFAGVAVLDRPGSTRGTRPASVAPDEPEPTSADEPALAVPDEDVVPDVKSESDAPPARRRTTPEAGSAAERAAARRARLREQRGDRDDNGKEGKR